MPLDSLQKCVNLRVLSISTNSSTGNSHHFKDRVSATQIFMALQSLDSLEYFEWSEPLNILTEDILALYGLLSKHLPNLAHWHWKLCYFLLFVTDLDNTMYQINCNI